MIYEYLAFTFWLVVTIFAGTGVYRMWTKMVKPVWVNWALLPGTVVSEMAYIFGSLITGGEISKARIVPAEGDRAGGEPTATATPRMKVVGPLVASLMSLIGCGAAILLVNHLLGAGVMAEFVAARSGTESALNETLPSGWLSMWLEADTQIKLLRNMCETLTSANWLDWKSALFIYLSICLAVRFGPVSRPSRPTLAAVVVIAITIALLAAMSQRFDALIDNFWPLLSYVYALLMFLLVVTLMIRGVITLWLILAGKDKGVASRPR